MVPVMMVNQWIRDEAILRLLENGIPVHLTQDSVRRAGVRVSIQGDSPASGTPGRVVLEATPTAGPGELEARNLAETAAGILRAAGYDVAADQVGALVGRTRATYRLRHPYASWARI